MSIHGKKVIVNSGEFGARSDGATPISNRRATSDDVTNFSSIDYKIQDVIMTRVLLPKASLRGGHKTDESI
ncbi:MAG: palindromic element RPE2 domain-containing protein [Rickettsia endosymbiont of Pseudomimeciton antennatum]|nr:palindromic element RPE2 domain-containing protein [Rickettsia endosymbiont of Pseudomimeciton antennatum]